MRLSLLALAVASASARARPVEALATFASFARGDYAAFLAAADGLEASVRDFARANVEALQASGHR